MTSQAIGNYIKVKAKAEGDFISIYLPSAYHTLDAMTHFFFQKKHEWFAICFLDEHYQCHAIWLEKGKDVNAVDPIISIYKTIKFSKLNNFKNIILAHNHTITTDDILYYRSYGINIINSIEVKRQFLKFSDGDKLYSKMFLYECQKHNINFISSVIVGGEFYIEGHQVVLNNIKENMPFFREFRQSPEKVIPYNANQQFKELVFKTEKRTSKKTKYKGLIGYYNLCNWWNISFSLDEQLYIASIYNKIHNKEYDSDFEVIKNSKLIDLSDCILTETKVTYSSYSSSLQFGSSLIIGFNNKRNTNISLKVLEKVEELINDSTPILDIHFFYLRKISIYFRLRDVNSRFFNKMIESCYQQIKISSLASKAFSLIGNDGFIPSHTGFKRLAIINEKEKKYEEVISLCQRALNEGWNGDWMKRINRCRKKMN